MDMDTKSLSMGRHAAKELGRLVQIAGPLWAQNFASLALGLIAIAFVGHMGDPLALSQVVLANSIFNVTGASIVSGLSAGMETFCGQAMGAGNHRLLGTVLQRACLICLSVCFPIMLLWYHAEPIILHLGQPAPIAAGAARYLWRSAPALWLLAVSECIKRYLLAQRVVVPGTAITTVTTAVAPLFYYIAMIKLKLGLDGAAAAFVLCNATSTTLLAAYTAARDWRRRGTRGATWEGLSREAFGGWGAYLTLAVPALVAITSEWWTYEVVIFMAGLLPNAEVAVGVMGLAFQISAVAYMSAMSLSAAVNTRVANELGAGNATAARLSCWTALAVVLAVQSSVSLGCLAAGRRVVAVLSNDARVEDLTMQIMPVLVSSFVGDGANAVLQGVLRGAGRQLLGACLNLAGYWAFGVPLAVVLAFKAGLGVLGFWSALVATTSAQALLQAGVISRFDWDAEVARAEELIGGAGGGGGKRGRGTAEAAAGGGPEACFGVVGAGDAADDDMVEEGRPLLLRGASSMGSGSVSIDLVSVASFRRPRGGGAVGDDGAGDGGGGERSGVAAAKLALFSLRDSGDEEEEDNAEEEGLSQRQGVPARVARDTRPPRAERDQSGSS